MVAAWFTEIGSAITQFINAMKNVFTSIGEMIYVSGEGGGLTFLGTILAIAAGVGIVYWAFSMVRRLISRRAG